MEPVILYDLFPVEEVRPGEVVLREARLRSKGVAKLWAQAQEVALILCTIGPALDEQVSAYFVASDPLRGLVLDAIGTAALEELAEEACHLIAEVAKGKGWEASAPLSPNYRRKLNEYLRKSDMVGIWGFIFHLQQINICATIPR